MGPSAYSMILRLCNNCIHPVTRTGKDYFPQLFNPFSSLRPVTTALEDFEFPLDIKESMLLLLSLPGLFSEVLHPD